MFVILDDVGLDGRSHLRGKRSVLTWLGEEHDSFPCPGHGEWMMWKRVEMEDSIARLKAVKRSGFRDCKNGASALYIRPTSTRRTAAGFIQKPAAASTECKSCGVNTVFNE